MNPTEASHLMDLIRKIRDEMKITVILIDHNMRAVLGICDKLTVLNHGQKLFEEGQLCLKVDEHPEGKGDEKSDEEFFTVFHRGFIIAYPGRETKLSCRRPMSPRR